MLFKFISVCTFLSTTIQDDCKRRTTFLVFRGFEGIYFFLCICDNRPWHFRSSGVASPFCLFELCLAIFWAVFTGVPCFLVVTSERGFLCLSKNLQFSSKQGRTSGSLYKTLLFVFNSSKGYNGFENIVKWHRRKPFFQLLCQNFTIVITQMRKNIAQPRFQLAIAHFRVRYDR